MTTISVAVALWEHELAANRGNPRCMTKVEYKSWLEAEAEAPTKPCRFWACRDCSNDYAKSQGNKCALKGLNITKITK